MLRPVGWAGELNPKGLFPELESVNDAVEVLDGAAIAEPAASLEAAAGEKVGTDAIVELEMGEVRSFDDGLAESEAVDFTPSVAPPIPNDKLLAGFTSAAVPSDLAGATIDKPTEPLEERLYAGDDDKIAGLLLEAPELTAGLSVGGTVWSFGDEE